MAECPPQRMKLTRTDSHQGIVTLPSIRDLGIEGLRSGRQPPPPEQAHCAPVYTSYQQYHPQQHAGSRSSEIAVVNGTHYPDTPPRSVHSSIGNAQQSFSFMSDTNMSEAEYWSERSERRNSSDNITLSAPHQTTMMQDIRRNSSPSNSQITTRGRPANRKRSAPTATSSPDRRKKDQRNAHQKESRAEEAFWIEINAALNRKLFEAEGHEKFTACARPVGENNRKQTGSDNLKIYRGATKVSELRMLAAVMMRLWQLHSDPSNRDKLADLLDVYQEAAPPMTHYHGVVPGLPLPHRAQADPDASPKRPRSDS